MALIFLYLNNLASFLKLKFTSEMSYNLYSFQREMEICPRLWKSAVQSSVQLWLC